MLYWGGESRFILVAFGVWVDDWCCFGSVSCGSVVFVLMWNRSGEVG